jgi:proteasome accessory factor C
MAASAAPRTESDRFERWLELIPHCNRAEEGIELDQLAAVFEDSPEAILGDVQALVDREYYLPGSFADSLTILIDGERLDLTSPDHFQRPVRFSPMEALALQLGLQAVLEEQPDGEEESVKAALAELAAVLEAAGDTSESNSTGGADEIDALACASGLSGVAPDVLAELRRGLRERKVVELEYFKPYGPADPTARRVEPWALAAVHGTWYFLGHDLGVGDVRRFRLDRILSAQATSETAQVPENLNVENYIDPQRVFRESEDNLEVSIQYSPRIARWIQERYGDDAATSPDGSVTIRHRCRSLWWAVGRALGCGLEASITTPEGASALVVQMLGRLQAA